MGLVHSDIADRERALEMFSSRNWELFGLGDCLDNRSCWRTQLFTIKNRPMPNLLYRDLVLDIHKVSCASQPCNDNQLVAVSFVRVS